jgi:hypothetical protein
MAVGESGIRLFQFGVSLHSMAHGQHGLVVQIQLGCQFFRRLTLANAPHEENDLLGCPLTALKDCACVQVVNRSALRLVCTWGISAPLDENAQGSTRRYLLYQGVL